MYMLRSALSACLLVAASAVPAQAEERPAAGLSTSLNAKIYRLEPVPAEAEGAVSAWYYTMTAPDFILTGASLAENIEANGRRFCAGEGWKVLRKTLEPHRIEFAFSCHGASAERIRDAAVRQGLPTTSLK